MSASTTDRVMEEATCLIAPEDPLDLTVILPAYNEVDSVDGIYEQVRSVLAGCGRSYEVVFVDDGSTDGTWQKICALSLADPRVRAIRHRRNFGKASALANGFTYARGRIIVTSDADMQYDPNDILRLIAKVEEGHDIVSAYKVVRRDPLGKRIPSWFFNFFVRKTTGVPLHDINAGLKAFTYPAANALVRYGYGELHRFFVILGARNGYCVAEVPVESLYRTSGRSKYGMERYMRGALDYLTVLFLSGYAERPLHLLGSAGVWLSLLGTVMFATVFGISIGTRRSMADNPFLGVSELLVVTGVQVIVAGLIAEMINNLERHGAGRAKIAQVVRIERRAPGHHEATEGFQVDRRGPGGGSIPDGSAPSSEQAATAGTE